MGHSDFGLPEYHQAAAKAFGNLYERMHFVNDKKEVLRLLLEEEINRLTPIGAAAQKLFVAIMDLETEVSQYKSDRKSRC